MLERLIKIILATIFSVGSLPEAIHNVDIEDKTKYGILTYAINTMRSVVEDDVFNVRIESENGNYEGEASQVFSSSI